MTETVTRLKTGCTDDQFHFRRACKDTDLYTGVRQHGVMADSNDDVTVRVEDPEDRWRWVCPNGHRTWEPTNHHFWCQSCARRKSVDGVFHHLHDRKTGDQYARDEVQLVTATGPHDPDLDRRGST